jgi:chromosome segregation ATPase
VVTLRDQISNYTAHESALLEREQSIHSILTRGRHALELQATRQRAKIAEPLTHATHTITALHRTIADLTTQLAATTTTSSTLPPAVANDINSNGSNSDNNNESQVSLLRQSLQQVSDERDTLLATRDSMMTQMNDILERRRQTAIDDAQVYIQQSQTLKQQHADAKQQYDQLLALHQHTVARLNQYQQQQKQVDRASNSTITTPPVVSAPLPTVPSSSSWRNMSWRMLGTATVALFVAGVIGVCIGTNTSTGATRRS